jgi:hypothetical protein
MAARHVKYEFLARTLHNRFDWQSRVGAVSQLSSSLCLNGLPCVINFGVQLDPDVTFHKELKSMKDVGWRDLVAAPTTQASSLRPSLGAAPECSP